MVLELCKVQATLNYHSNEPDLFNSTLLVLYWNKRLSSVTKKHFFPYFEKQKEIHNLTYISEVPAVESLLGRIWQIPLFLSEVLMHIIKSHCILKYEDNTNNNNKNQKPKKAKYLPNTPQKLCHFWQISFFCDIRILNGKIRFRLEEPRHLLSNCFRCVRWHQLYPERGLTDARLWHQAVSPYGSTLIDRSWGNLGRGWSPGSEESEPRERAVFQYYLSWKGANPRGNGAGVQCTGH